MLRLLVADSAQDSFAHKSDRNIVLAVRLERWLQCEIQIKARVHVSGDVVQLFGVVSTWYYKQKAQELARELAPQFRIRNDIRVADA